MKAILLFLLLATLPQGAQVERAMPVAIAVTREFPPSARQTMMCVAYYESSFRPDARGSLGERGVFQILLDSSVWPILRRYGYTPDDLLRVGPNIKVAAEMWRERGLRPWMTQKGRCW